MRVFGRGMVWLISILILAGCTTDFDLTAPEKDIWVVYGILNPGDSVQYVRVYKGFLPESDAFEYARDSSMSLPGMLVTLTDGIRTWEAEQVDSVLKQPEDGTFYPYQTLYRFNTSGNDELELDTEYELEVTQPGNDTFSLRASTLTPDAARIFSPTTTPGQGRDRCLQQVNLESDFTLTFNNEQATAYEIRVYLDYFADEVQQEAVFGPTTLFVDDVRCNQVSNFCYRFGTQEILRSFSRQLSDHEGAELTYGVDDDTRCASDVADLPRVLRFEVTSMDAQLYNYRQVNSAQVSNINTVRPEYTNVEGPEGSITLGILGSYSTAFSYGRLSECSEYLLNLNGTESPNGACSFQ